MYEIEFLLGVLSYQYRAFFSKLFPGLQIICAIALYLVMAWAMDRYAYSDEYPLRFIGFGTIAFLLINGALGVEEKFIARFGRTAFLLKRLGDASYVLYLSHWLILSIMGKIAAPMAQAPLLFVIAWHLFSLFLCLAFALVFSERIEMPMHRRIKNAFSPSPLKPT